MNSDDESLKEQRRKCTPCWAVLVFVVLSLIFGAGWVAHVIDMVLSGRGFETVPLIWGGHTQYINEFVFICAIAIAAGGGIVLNIREYLLWRDLERKYGGKPTAAEDQDSESRTNTDTGERRKFARTELTSTSGSSVNNVTNSGQ